MAHDTQSDFADVSVIIAAYQASDTIVRALASIAAQTLKPFEVVVVDDGSTDTTFEVAKEYEPYMNGIRLRMFQSNSNHGAGAARNQAIKESSGQSLAFLDADDEWLPEKLERSMTYLADSDYCLVAHDYLVGEGDSAIHHDCERRSREGNDAFSALYRKGYIPSCSVVAPRERVIAAGGFDPSLRNAQDFDLWLAMTRDPTATFLVFGEPLLRYHISEDGIMGHTARRLKCCLIIARRYMPDLKRRSGSGLSSVWFRITALHLEAIRAFSRKGLVMQLLMTALALPFSLIKMTGLYFLGTPPPRGRYLARNLLAESSDG
jgi:teichuronic acid biosynthesis glycosyltransferase TuaG